MSQPFDATNPEPPREVPTPPPLPPPPPPSTYPAAPSTYAAAPPPMPAGYGAALPPNTYYDPASGVILPNGIALASVGRRIGGYFLEFLLFIVTLGIGYIVWDLIVWARGQTPGKQVLGLRCFQPAQQRIAPWGWMAMRQFLGGIVEGLIFPVIFIISAIMMITSKDHKAIHDHMASTVVLYDPDKLLAGR